MIRMIRRLLRQSEGAILAYVALILPLFIGFIALGLDVAAWHIEKRQSQTMADAAAMAAALTASRLEAAGESESDVKSGAEDAALEAAKSNLFDDEDADNTLTVNIPPTRGNYEDEEKAVEAIVRLPLPLFLSGAVSELWFTRSEAGARFASSRAVAIYNDSAPACVWALDEEAESAVEVGGNATVTLECGVFSNSEADSGVDQHGSGCLQATNIEVAGGTTPGCYVDEDGEPLEPTTDVGHRSDPLAGLPEAPEPEGCDFPNLVQFSGQNGGTLDPGTYCGGIRINTSEPVQFNPGEYILNGGDFVINAQANVTGEDVTFFIADNGDQSTTITINGGAAVNLEAPSSGTWQGILFYEDRDAPANTHNFNGGSGMDLEGILYFPNSHLRYAGNNASDSNGTALVANTVQFTGTSDFVALDLEPGNPLFSSFFGNAGARLVE